METIKLTQFSESSGCGCKIEPAVLHEIIEKSGTKSLQIDNLLVGNESMDDAAVFLLNDGQALVSTVDFFTPIVDDAFDFGCIAAANAISDIYAMGARPAFANAILSWPVDKLGTDLAARVMEGARHIANKAGVVIAGGHSIAGKEPVFGLAVNGFANAAHIKRNNTAKAGDLLYLTKPIGIGVLATAIKRGKIATEDYAELVSVTCALNTFGSVIAGFAEVHAMTDVTGFGLLGHTIEMCEGSGLSAEIILQNIPVMDSMKKYAEQYIFPDNTYKNWNAYTAQTDGVDGMELVTLCDPQTSGGLLIAVDPAFQQAFERISKENNTTVYEVGRITQRREKTVYVRK